MTNHQTKKVKMKPPIEYLQECFSLQNDGSLVWKNRPDSHFSDPAHATMTNKQVAGRPAGCLGKDGYLVVRVARLLLPLHLVVFAMANGFWPELEIDHKDRNRRNNLPSNLREATRPQNMANATARKNSKTGAKGVIEHTPGVYRARIYVDGKSLHLGVYKDIEEAKLAYRNAEVKHRLEFAS